MTGELELSEPEVRAVSHNLLAANANQTAPLFTDQRCISM